MRYPFRDIKRMTLATILLFLTLSVALVVTERIFVGVQATPETKISVLNPLTGNGNFTFSTSITSVGYRFNATVWVEDVTDLFGYQVYLGITPPDMMLNITRAWLPKWDPLWVFAGRQTGSPEPKFPPYANFTFSPASPTANEIMTFDASASWPWHGGIIKEYRWSFGDGNTTTVTNPIITHVYSTTKNYTVNLTVYDDKGLTDTESKVVVVGGPPIATPPATTRYVKKVKIGDAIVTGQTFNGTGLLVIIEFEILSAPSPEVKKVSYNLEIDNVDTYLLNFNVEKISSSKINGYFEYEWRALAQLEVEPSNYTAVELETFNVTVRLNNIDASQALVNATFSLRYNATLLNPIQVIEEPFLAGFGFTFDYYFGVENVTIKHSMNPPYANFPTGSGAIATAIFQGIYQDSKENNSTLELVDILLKDYNGNEIATALKNGTYNILPIGSSIITIYATPASVEVGSDIVISGTLKPTRSNVNITIYYRATNEVWNTLATTKTNSHSNYTFPWTTTGEGNYEIKANWAGDASTNPAESEKKAVTIRAKPSTIDFTLYAAVGAGITILIAIAVATYFLKIKKPKRAT